MSKELTVDEVREKPDELIAALERGESVTITKEGEELATVEPTIGPKGMRFPFRDLAISPLKKPLGVDPVEELIAERERERSGKKYGL